MPKATFNTCLLWFAVVLNTATLTAQTSDSVEVQQSSAGKTWEVGELDTLFGRGWAWQDSTFKDPVLNGKDSIPEILPRLIRLVAYEFPVRPDESGLQPDIVLRLLIDKKGKVRAYYVRKDSGIKGWAFEQIALAIARGNSWEPARFRGKSLATWVTYTCNFRSTVVPYDDPIFKEGIKWRWSLLNETPSLPVAERLPDGTMPPKRRSDSEPTTESEQIPEVIDLTSPIYPRAALSRGKQTSIEVKILIDKTGTVRFATIQKPSKHPEDGFEDSAVRAAIQGKRKPAMQDGKPVAVWVTYPIKYRLR